VSWNAGSYSQICRIVGGSIGKPVGKYLFKKVGWNLASYSGQCLGICAGKVIGFRVGKYVGSRVCRHINIRRNTGVQVQVQQMQIYHDSVEDEQYQQHLKQQQQQQHIRSLLPSVDTASTCSERPEPSAPPLPEEYFVKQTAWR